MIQFDNETGRRFLERILVERVIWLTTVSPGGTPQPRPVWFVWDDGDFIVYSNAHAKKLGHIANNPNVALHFNTDADGYDVQVILGKARVDAKLPPTNLNKAYSEKYGEEILTLDMDEKRYAELYSVGLRITTTRLRGLEPIPENP
jgi:PPOX class probable F420-dependent enzyme